MAAIRYGRNLRKQPAGLPVSSTGRCIDKAMCELRCDESSSLSQGADTQCNMRTKTINLYSFAELSEEAK